MSKLTVPTILVIVGISGDLAKRKLLPAIREIAASDTLPDDFHVVGISRRDLDIDEILPEQGDQEFLRKVLQIRKMDLENIEDYKALDTFLRDIEGDKTDETQRLFYLSVPPMASQPVIELMGMSGLAKVKNTKLLLEKPFGTDLDSAEELIEHIRTHFDEDQVYRIDHYLAKEMTQNLVVFRSGNALFRRTWDKNFIESIDISASQEMGIEGRAAFYEQTGALRDIVQSHLLQLAALTLMELPTHDNLQAIPAERLKALDQLSVSDDNGPTVTRGQYKEYKSEVENPDSIVETFVSLNLKSSDPRWEGVPITLSTGKGLDHTATDITISYKRDEAHEDNTLILRIQPNEGVEVRLWAKQPGFDRELRQVALNFSYSDHFSGLPEAYERVFVDAMRSDHSLFTGSEEVLASWRILAPIQKEWAASDGSDLVVYDQGTSCTDITKRTSKET